MGKIRPRAPSHLTVSHTDDPLYGTPEADAAFQALRARLRAGEWQDHPGLDDAYVWRQLVGNDYKAELAFSQGTKGLALAHKHGIGSLTQEKAQPVINHGSLFVHNLDKQGTSPPSLPLSLSPSLPLSPSSLLLPPPLSALLQLTLTPRKGAQPSSCGCQRSSRSSCRSPTTSKACSTCSRRP